jgi:hypothetical protein
MSDPWQPPARALIERGFTAYRDVVVRLIAAGQLNAALAADYEWSNTLPMDQFTAGSDFSYLARERRHAGLAPTDGDNLRAIRGTYRFGIFAWVVAQGRSNRDWLRWGAAAEHFSQYVETFPEAVEVVMRAVRLARTTRGSAFISEPTRRGSRFQIEPQLLDAFAALALTRTPAEDCARSVVRREGLKELVPALTRAVTAVEGNPFPWREQPQDVAPTYNERKSAALACLKALVS